MTDLLPWNSGLTLAQTALADDQPEAAIAWIDQALAQATSALQTHPPLDSNLGEPATERTQPSPTPNPDQWSQLWLTRAIALQASGDHGAALGSIDHAVEYAPDSVEVWFERGCIYKLAGDLNEALRSFDEVLRLCPDHSLAWHQRGRVLGTLNQKQAAIDSLDQSLALLPTADCWLDRGRVLARLGRMDEALASFDETLCLEPTNSEALMDRAFLLAQLRRYQESAEAYEKAAQYVEHNAVVFYSTARSWALAGNPEQAAIAISRAINLDPERTRAIVENDTSFDRVRDHPILAEAIR